MDTAGPQQSLHLLGRFFNHLARIVDLNHQLNESLISAVETPCQYWGNVKEHICGQQGIVAREPISIVNASFIADRFGRIRAEDRYVR